MNRIVAIVMGVLVSFIAQPASAEQTRDLQAILSERNCQPGPIDGAWGARTQGALERFNTASGLAVSRPITVQDIRDIRASDAQCPAPGVSARATSAPQPRPASAGRTAFDSPDFGAWSMICDTLCYAGYEGWDLEGTDLYVVPQGRHAYSVEIRNADGGAWAPGSRATLGWNHLKAGIPEVTLSNQDGVLRVDGRAGFEAATALDFQPPYINLIDAQGNRSSALLPSTMVTAPSGVHSSTGLGATLRAAHERNGTSDEFVASAFSGGTIQIGGQTHEPDAGADRDLAARQAAQAAGSAGEAGASGATQAAAAPAGSAAGGAGCSDGDLDAEANAYVEAQGAPPAFASGAWRHGYQLVLGLRQLVEEQGRRCGRDMSVAINYYDELIAGMENTGRAAGWL